MSTVRVLVVDDEDSVRLTLVANLELEGFETLEARNGAEAVEVIKSRDDIDLVLTDVRMPILGGLELFRAIRELGRDLPVIMMTAFAEESILHDAITEGVFAVLNKPFDPDDAASVLRRASDRPHVLVVDDMQRDADALVAALEVCGVRAVAVYGGQEAIEALQSGGIDVVLTDLKMPEMDGVELTRRIRELHPKSSIIAFSGFDVPEMMRDSTSFGANRCLRKPLHGEKLVEAIARLRGTA